MPTTIPPKITAEQKSWIADLTPSERVTFEAMLKQDPEILTNPQRFQGVKEELEYVRNF